MFWSRIASNSGLQGESSEAQSQTCSVCVCLLSIGMRQAHVFEEPKVFHCLKLCKRNHLLSHSESYIDLLRI